MNQQSLTRPSRREFMATTAAASAALVGCPYVVTARKTDVPLVVGAGDHRFEVEHNWPALPDRFTWQTTHGVAVDSGGLVYVLQMGHAEAPRQPTIFVFDDAGRYVRSFGEQFHGGGHGLAIRREDGQEFLYVCCYKQLKTFAKLDLRGETVWQKFAPMASGRYADDEDENHTATTGRDRFQPTNFAFLEDGGFLLADGYGAFCIHRYDKHGSWLSCFGGPGDGAGEFNIPHGLWVEQQNGRDASIVVCDRAHHAVQCFSIDGNHQRTITGFALPCNFATQRGLAVVPELYGRVTLVNEQREIVARLGDDSERIAADTELKIRRDRRAWQEGKFVHPHDACFTADGDILVAEWVPEGRVTRLKRMS